MLFNHLPDTSQAVAEWAWADFAPYYADLEGRALSAETIDSWLADWTRVNELLDEVGTRLHVATTQDTTDEAAGQAFKNYLDHIQPSFSTAEQALKEKLLASGLEPAGFEIPLRKLRAEADIYRVENIPLQTQVSKLGLEYDRINGTQSVDWGGEEQTLVRAYALLDAPDRAQRESLWRRIADRHLQDRDELNSLWQQMLDLRQKIAINAGFENFRDYQWRSFKRFDYTPADCETFHAAIEAVVVPAATRVYQRQAQWLGVDQLRPWDMTRDNVYPPARPQIHAYDTVEDLESTAEAIFRQVDFQLADYYGVMRRENLLDLGNRKGKGPGGYCTVFPVARRPFIFMNAVGSEGDVRTLLHEAGHAFHGFAVSELPYHQQKNPPIEFAEVASMAMELLSAPYWSASKGGYYSDDDTAYARRQHLENILLFWPFMAVVDAFQHWAYTHTDAAMKPDHCDAKWGELWDRFIPGVDWGGLEDAKVTGWQRKLHIFSYPFYYVDYGLAQLGALQVWHNALTDQAGAVAAYRQALALGGTASLPDLFAAAGARFAFDAETVKELVELIEQTLDDLMAE